MGVQQLSNWTDVTVQPLYDTATIPAAGTLQLNFFQQQLGAAGGNFAAAAAPKTLADTNMDLSGQLPAGQNFRVLGFRAQPHFALTQADAVKWSSGAWFVFTVGQKPYLRVPVDCLPAGLGAFGFYTQAAAATAAVASHGYPVLSNGFTIGKKPLDLTSTQNFVGTMQWTAVVAVTTTAPVQPAAGLPIRLYMDGFFYRIVQ